MIDAKDAEHVIIHRDEFAYCAHPHMAVAKDGSWLIVFNRASRRAFVLHPLLDLSPDKVPTADLETVANQPITPLP